MVDSLVPANSHSAMTSNESGGTDERILLTWWRIGDELIVIMKGREEVEVEIVEPMF